MIHIITIHNRNDSQLLRSNGIGILTDFRSSPNVKEALNGEFYIEFEYNCSGRYAEYLVEENIIVSPVGYGERQAFRISKSKKIIDDTNLYIYVYAKHISYDLVDNVVEDSYVQDKNGNDAIGWILSHTQYSHNFTGYSDIPTRNNARYVFKNPIQILISDDDNSFLNRWGGEIVRDNFSIKMLQARGKDNGVHIRYRKNLKGITFETDYSTIATKVRPKGYDGLELPEKYVESSLINNYVNPKITEIEYSDIKIKENEEDEEGFLTAEECYEEMRRRVKKEYENGLDKPSLSATVDFIELSKTIEYQEYKNLEKLCIGDTVHIDIDEFNLEITEKVISTIYDPILERYTGFEIGKEFSSYTLEVKNYEKQLEEVIIPNKLDAAKQHATDLLTTALGGYITKTRNELFIADNEDINKAEKVWRWNINGLGYSSTGVNGLYGTAMTMDGQIVADYITTGTMSVERIEGLSNTLEQFAQLTIEVDKVSTLVVDTSKEFEERMTEFDVSINNIKQQISQHTTDISNVKNEAINGAIKATEEELAIKLEDYPTKVEVDTIVTTKAGEIETNLTGTINTQLSSYAKTTVMEQHVQESINSYNRTISETYITKTASKQITDSLSSRIGATASDISLTVSNNNTTAGITIKMTKEDGTTKNVSGTINMTGLVKFSDLSNAGSTTINGSNITTGTISASRIDMTSSTGAFGNGIYVTSPGWLAGGVPSPSRTK